MNRSTSGHAEMLLWGYQRITSYGTSDAVRLPGRQGATHAFAFGTRYADILARMLATDPGMREWMATFGLSNMLLRNAALKAAPESWRLLADDEVRGVDFALCFDRSVYNGVLSDIERRVKTTSCSSFSGDKAGDTLFPQGTSGASFSLLSSVPATIDTATPAAASATIDAALALISVSSAVSQGDVAAAAAPANGGDASEDTRGDTDGSPAVSSINPYGVQQVVVPSAAASTALHGPAKAASDEQAQATPGHDAPTGKILDGHPDDAFGCSAQLSSASPSTSASASSAATSSLPPSASSPTVSSTSTMVASSVSAPPSTGSSVPWFASTDVRSPDGEAAAPSAYRKQVVVVLLHTKDNINDAAVSARLSAKFADDFTRAFYRGVKRVFDRKQQEAEQAAAAERERRRLERAEQALQAQLLPSVAIEPLATGKSACSMDVVGDEEEELLTIKAGADAASAGGKSEVERAPEPPADAPAEAPGPLISDNQGLSIPPLLPERCRSAPAADAAELQHVSGLVATAAGDVGPSGLQVLGASLQDLDDASIPARSQSCVQPAHAGISNDDDAGSSQEDPASFKTPDLKRRRLAEPVPDSTDAASVGVVQAAEASSTADVGLSVQLPPLPLLMPAPSSSSSSSTTSTSDEGSLQAARPAGLETTPTGHTTSSSTGSGSAGTLFLANDAASASSSSVRTATFSSAPGSAMSFGSAGSGAPPSAASGSNGSASANGRLFVSPPRGSSSSAGGSSASSAFFLRRPSVTDSASGHAPSSGAASSRKEKVSPLEGISLHFDPSPPSLPQGLPHPEAIKASAAASGAITSPSASAPSAASPSAATSVLVTPSATGGHPQRVPRLRTQADVVDALQRHFTAQQRRALVVDAVNAAMVIAKQAYGDANVAVAFKEL